jgi:hypothetical protein
VAAFKSDTEDDDALIPNGGMALDLTSDLGERSSHDDTLSMPTSVVVHSQTDEATGGESSTSAPNPAPSEPPKTNEKANAPIT